MYSFVSAVVEAWEVKRWGGGESLSIVRLFIWVNETRGGVNGREGGGGGG